MKVEGTTYQRQGFLDVALPLTHPDDIDHALADVPLFEAALARFEQEGRRQVPYLLTDSIRRLAVDPAIVATVQTLLGTDQWVMWGANIRKSIPNQAQNWHTDLESVLWPSITIALGLSGCKPEGATLFIPGSQAIGRGPASCMSDVADTHSVVRKAQQLVADCTPPCSIDGFADGRFYAFNGGCWHRANEHGADGKVVLYMHYQAAADKRIPLMLDYTSHTWSRKACPYMLSPNAGSARSDVYQPPLRHRLGSWLSSWRRPAQ